MKGIEITFYKKDFFTERYDKKVNFSYIYDNTLSYNENIGNAFEEACKLGHNPYKNIMWRNIE